MLQPNLLIQLSHNSLKRATGFAQGSPRTYQVAVFSWNSPKNADVPCTRPSWNVSCCRFQQVEVENWDFSSLVWWTSGDCLQKGHLPTRGQLVSSNACVSQLKSHWPTQLLCTSSNTFEDILIFNFYVLRHTCFSTWQVVTEWLHLARTSEDDISYPGAHT